MTVYHYETFPKAVGKLCVRMLKELGLKFGVYDFIKERRTGTHYFLELNPNRPGIS